MGLRSLSMPEASDFQYENIAPGLYVARLQIIADLGVHATGYGNKHMVYLGYEVVSDLSHNEVLRTDGTRFMLAERSNGIALSLGVNKGGRESHLRERLGQFDGKKLTDSECEGLDLSRYIGRPIILGVINTPDKSDPNKVFNNIGSGNPYTDPREPLPATSDLIFFDYEEDDPSTLPEWLQKKLGARPGEEVEPQEQTTQQPPPQVAQQAEHDSLRGQSAAGMGFGVD